MRVHPLAPVIGLDVDGTVGDYHQHFVNFLTHVYFPHSGGLFDQPFMRPDWRPEYEGEFSRALAMNKEEYRAAKLAYRLGGNKRCLPLFSQDRERDGKDAIRNEIQTIRAMGIQVWICTQRPWLSLTSVDPDTQYWLHHNVGEVDGLVYGEDKYADLVDIVGYDRVLGVVEDLPECIERAQMLGLNTAMRAGPHNAYWKGSPDFKFKKFREVGYIVKRWKEEGTK